MRYVLAKVGPGTSFQSGFVISNPEKVSIGANCGFARRTFITGGGGVCIGDWVSFGPDVKGWSVNHRYTDPDTPHLLQGWDAKPVVIEDDAWLGANVFVMPGVTIGRGAVVSAYTCRECGLQGPRRATRGNALEPRRLTMSEPRPAGGQLS